MPVRNDKLITNERRTAITKATSFNKLIFKSSIPVDLSRFNDLSSLSINILGTYLKLDYLTVLLVISFGLQWNLSKPDIL